MDFIKHPSKKELQLNPKPYFQDNNFACFLKDPLCSANAFESGWRLLSIEIRTPKKPGFHKISDFDFCLVSFIWWFLCPWPGCWQPAFCILTCFSSQILKVFKATFLRWVLSGISVLRGDTAKQLLDTGCKVHTTW